MSNISRGTKHFLSHNIHNFKNVILQSLSCKRICFLLSSWMVDCTFFWNKIWASHMQASWVISPLISSESMRKQYGEGQSMRVVFHNVQCSFFGILQSSRTTRFLLLWICFCAWDYLKKKSIQSRIITTWECIGLKRKHVNNNLKYILTHIRRKRKSQHTKCKSITTVFQSLIP